MIKTLNIGIFLLFIFTSAVVFSQNSMMYADEDLNFKKGIELFEQERYAQAQYFFNLAIEYYGDEHTDIKADAEYYMALCAIELFNADAEYRMEQFIANYPESPLTRLAYFEMGRYKYRNRKYDDALFYFVKVWKQNLSEQQLYEYYFKRGYCYFKQDEFNKASKMFYEVLNKDTKYAAPAQYFYAHIAYTQKNYQTALKGFMELKEDPTFAPIVPYYVVQIYYLQGKNDKVLEYGKQLLNLPKTKREAEISRLVGEALYAKEQYAEALEYLEKYKEKADKYTREDIYQLGYVYYKTGDYESAVATFTNITNVSDALTQNAYFHMADCYLKLDKKEQARMAFEAASKLDFDRDIKEISLLNYAKLSYELSYSPFNETIKAFEDYLISYPNSIHHDEAYSYLVKVYLTSKNYQAALTSLEKIKVKSPEMLAAYQRVAFFRGLELFNNLYYSAALAAFDLSLSQTNFDKHLHSLAVYWKGEALYRLDRYSEAAKMYNEFLLTPGAYLTAEYNNCYYNLGYCLFKQKNYQQAVSWFRKYTDKGNDVDQVKRADAFIRIGDCYFMERRYRDAVDYYGNAVALDTFDIDYAMFQKGFSYGLMKQYDKKIEAMSALLNREPHSSYAADALYERGRSYVTVDSAKKAIEDFNTLLTNYPNSIYRVKALLQLGLLYYSENEYEKALANYKTVVSDYPGTTDANDAMLGIKNIYVDMNRVDDYFAYVKEQGGEERISITEKDSLTYLAAEKIYMSGNWNMAKSMFTRYINEFAEGRFALNAHYYRGDCNMKAGSNDSALIDFVYVIDKQKNIFTESSLLNAARLYEEANKDSLAYITYNKLENMAEVKINLLIARKGQMQAAYKLGHYKEAVEAAQRVLITDKVPEEDIREARLIKANSYRAQGLMDAALVQYRILAQDVKNREGAEGKYRVAEILFSQGNSKEAEEEILNFINQGTPHAYWLAKSFLLLSDIYLAYGDAFQAKANLQSLIDNYGNSDDGIVIEAKTKLSAIVEKENSKFITNDTIAN